MKYSFEKPILIVLFHSVFYVSISKYVNVKDTCIKSVKSVDKEFVDIVIDFRRFRWKRTNPLQKKTFSLKKSI